MSTTTHTPNAAVATQTADHCDRNPRSPGSLVVEEAEDHSPDYGSYNLAAVDNQQEIVAKVYTCCGRERANADRLARTWNSHDTLLAALEKTVHCLAYHVEMCGNGVGCDAEYLRQARAALAAAK